MYLLIPKVKMYVLQLTHLAKSLAAEFTTTQVRCGVVGRSNQLVEVCDVELTTKYVSPLIS